MTENSTIVLYSATEPSVTKNCTIGLYSATEQCVTKNCTIVRYNAGEVVPPKKELAATLTTRSAWLYNSYLLNCDFKSSRIVYHV